MRMRMLAVFMGMPVCVRERAQFSGKMPVLKRHKTSWRKKICLACLTLKPINPGTEYSSYAMMSVSAKRAVQQEEVVKCPKRTNL